MMRGIESRHELDPTLLLRDTRTFGQRVGDFFSDPTNISIVLFTLSAMAYYFSEAATLLMLVGAACFLYSYTRKQKLPFRLPQISRVKDYNDMKPGVNKPNIARGIAFFGNDRKTGHELWFANDDMRTHALIFGSTGSGKTECLVSLAFNALVQGSGFIYVDGKGDNSLYAKVFSMVRSMGREDDLLLINFMTGARDIIGPQEKRLSNTFNPFSQGSSSMLTQLVVSLMGDSKGGGDGDMWKGRAIAFVEALMRLLVYMRDEGAILLDADTIRNYFDLTRLETIVVDKIFPRDNQESVNIEQIPKLVTDPLRNYLGTLPGYNKEKKGQASITGLGATWFYYHAVGKSVFFFGRYLWTYCSYQSCRGRFQGRGIEPKNSRCTLARFGKISGRVIQLREDYCFFFKSDDGCRFGRRR